MYDFNLLCETKWSIGFLGSTYYFGELAASLLLSSFRLKSRINVVRVRSLVILVSLFYMVYIARTL